MKRYILLIIVSFFVNSISLGETRIKSHGIPMDKISKQIELEKEAHYPFEKSGSKEIDGNEHFIPNFETLKQEGRLERDGEFFLFTRLLQDWDDSLFYDSNKISRQNTSFSRDDSLLLAHRTWQTWDGNDWVNITRFNNIYNENGNLINMLWQNWNDEGWMNSFLISYTYDENSILITRLGQSANGNNWLNSYKYTFSYDENTNLINDLMQTWEGSDWVNDSQWNNTFDEYGNIINKLYQDWNEYDSDWVNDSQWTNTFDEYGNFINKLYQDWNEYDSDWENSLLITYSYDENENLIYELTQFWDDTIWVNNMQYTYTYDENGTLTENLSHQWWNDAWVIYWLATYSYDENGNLINLFVLDWDGSDWVNDYHYSITYDESGNRINELYQYWDNNNWVNEQQYVFLWTTGSPTFELIDDQEIDEDSILEIYVSVNYVINTSLSFTAYSDTLAVTVNVDSNLITLAPMNDWYGNTQITVIVSDENDLSDTTNFSLFVNPINDSPEEYSVLYPTMLDTFSTHTNSDTSIVFIWEQSIDVDSDIYYDLRLEFDFYGQNYYNTYLEIYDTTYSIIPSELDQWLAGLNLSTQTITWTLTAYDEEYQTTSSIGEFVLTRESLGLQNGDFIPDEFVLHQNYPNPFNPITTLRYDLPENSFVNVTVYDMLGRQVKSLINQTQDAGFKSVIWNATNNQGNPVSAGVYLYQIQAGDFVQTKKMVLLK